MTSSVAWWIALFATAQVTDLPSTKSGLIPPPRTGMAQLIVFRPPGFIGVALSCTVVAGETEIARLGPGRFRVIDRPSGRLTLSAREAKIPVELELRAGKRAFVQCRYGRGVTRGAPDVTIVDDEVFATKAARLKLASERAK